jgi:hypothetical protein
VVEDKSGGGDYEFNLLGVEDKEILERWARSPFVEAGLHIALKRVHRDKPKVVFLTQTSSIPFGFALKEAYKTAYPGDKPPRFLTVDVKPIRSWSENYDLQEEIYRQCPPEKLKGAIRNMGLRVGHNRGESRSELEKIYSPDNKDLSMFHVIELLRYGGEDFNRYFYDRLEERAERSAPAIVKKVSEKLRKYDVKKGDSVLIMDEMMKDKEKKGGRYVNLGTVGIIDRVLREAGSQLNEDIEVDHAYISVKGLPTRGLGPWVGAPANTYAPWKDGKFPPIRRFEDKEEREASKSNIDYLKDLGRKAGEEMVQKEKADLEGKVGAFIGIGGLLISLVFLSPNFTGNVISSLSLKTSNLFGVLLFLIGITGAFFSFRKRR